VLRLGCRKTSIFFIEAISKIVDYDQEQGRSRRKSAAYVQYVSILRRLLTQLLSVRCIFEIACRSVGKKKDKKAENYDPIENLKALHTFYPECSVYLSMLSFKQDWQNILPRI
jgi:hypothetical protein